MVAPISRTLVTPRYRPYVPAAPRPVRADAFTASSPPVIDPDAAKLLNLRRGNTGPRVIQLQNDLIKAGYLPADFEHGPFGPKTEAALKRFQADHGLAMTGVVDASTVKTLLGEPLPMPKAVPNAQALAGLERGATATAGDTRIATLHQALVDRGYLPASFTRNSGYGKRYGDLTMAAVQQLQRDFGLVPTGKLDAATAAVLGSSGFPPGSAFKGTWSSYPSLGAAQGPATRGPDGTTTQRFAGGTMTMSAGGELTVTGAMGAPLGTQQLGTVSTVAEANERFFLNQEGETPWYSSFNSDHTPYGPNDCGPTSALMAVTALGLAGHPTADEAPYAIDAMRDAILGPSNMSTTMGLASVKRGVEAYGAVGTALSVRGGNLDAVDAALDRGNPVILGGTPGNAWAKDLNKEGAYLDMGASGNASFGHFVAVLGRTDDGKYIVADPLSSKGAIEVTAEQLKTFLTQSGWGEALEVSRP